MKYLYCFLLLIGLLIFLNAQSPMTKNKLELEQKLNSNAFDALHFTSTNGSTTSKYWLSTSSGGRSELWQDYKLQKTFGLPSYTKGQLSLEESKKEIFGGYFTYNLNTEKANYQAPQLIETINKGVSANLVGRYINYAVENCVFDKEQDRLLLYLEYKAPKGLGLDLPSDRDIAHDILAMLYLTNNQLISVLDNDNSSGHQFLSLTKDYVVSASDKIHIWDLKTGALVDSLDHHLSEVKHIATQKPNNSFFFTLTNGTVHHYQIENKALTTIQAEGSGIHKCFPLKTAHSYLLSDAKNHCSIYQKHAEGTYQLHSDFQLDAELNDIYFDAENKRLFCATQASKDAIVVYSLEDL